MRVVQLDATAKDAKDQYKENPTAKNAKNELGFFAPLLLCGSFIGRNRQEHRRRKGNVHSPTWEWNSQAT
jgi:hypothetical protein